MTTSHYLSSSTRIRDKICKISYVIWASFRWFYPQYKHLIWHATCEVLTRTSSIYFAYGNTFQFSGLFRVDTIPSSSHKFCLPSFFAWFARRNKRKDVSFHILRTLVVPRKKKLMLWPRTLVTETKWNDNVYMCSWWTSWRDPCWVNESYKKHSESAKTINDIQHLCYHLCLFREVYKIMKAWFESYDMILKI